MCGQLWSSEPGCADHHDICEHVYDDCPAYGENNPSRVDVFLGYSYFGAHGQLKPQGIRYSSVDEGAIGSGAYYFNKYIGGEFSFIANPDGQNDGAYGAYAGPIVRAPMENFTLFAHAAAGATKLGGTEQREPGDFRTQPVSVGTKPAGRRRHGLRPAVLSMTGSVCASSRRITATSTPTSVRL